MKLHHRAKLNQNNIEASLFLSDDANEFYHPECVKESKLAVMKGSIEVDSITFDCSHANSDGGFYFKFYNFKVRNLENIRLHINLYFCECNSHEVRLFDKDLTVDENNYDSELDTATPAQSDWYPNLKPQI